MWGTNEELWMWLLILIAATTFDSGDKNCRNDAYMLEMVVGSIRMVGLVWARVKTWEHVFCIQSQQFRVMGRVNRLSERRWSKRRTGGQKEERPGLGWQEMLKHCELKIEGSASYRSAGIYYWKQRRFQQFTNVYAKSAKKTELGHLNWGLWVRDNG